MIDAGDRYGDVVVAAGRVGSVYERLTARVRVVAMLGHRGLDEGWWQGVRQTVCTQQDQIGRLYGLGNDVRYQFYVRAEAAGDDTFLRRFWYRSKTFARRIIVGERVVFRQQLQLFVAKQVGATFARVANDHMTIGKKRRRNRRTHTLTSWLVLRGLVGMHIRAFDGTFQQCLHFQSLTGIRRVTFDHALRWWLFGGTRPGRHPTDDIRVTSRQFGHQFVALLGWHPDSFHALVQRAQEFWQRLHKAVSVLGFGLWFQRPQQRIHRCQGIQILCAQRAVFDVFPDQQPGPVVRQETTHFTGDRVVGDAPRNFPLGLLAGVGQFVRADACVGAVVAGEGLTDGSTARLHKAALFSPMYRPEADQVEAIICVFCVSCDHLAGYTSVQLAGSAGHLRSPYRWA